VRELKQETTFKERFCELVPEEATRERILQGLRDTICKNPTVGVPVEEDHPEGIWYFFVPEAPAWDIPKLTGLYVFDAVAVYLNWINPA
jgi:hypothetical protein